MTKYHHKRLDTLLKGNRLKRKTVPADGDCFFNSVMTQLGEFVPPITTDGLRNQVANPLMHAREHYLKFMENSTVNTDEEEFAEQVDSLRHSGNWNTCIADVTPLAIANIFRRYVRIYSSNITNPVCDVILDLHPDKPYLGPAITIAHTAIPGNEHYDCAQSEIINTPPKTTIPPERKRKMSEKNNVDSSHITPKRKKILDQDPVRITPCRFALFRSTSKEKSTPKKVKEPKQVENKYSEV